MNTATFDIIADIMRYWIAVLILFIVFNVARSVFKQFSKEKQTRSKEQPYQMGMLEVIDAGRNNQLYGRHFALAMENVVGQSKKCDIRLNEPSIAPRQAMVFQKKGKQVFIRPLSEKNGVAINGEWVTEDTLLLDNDEIELGDVVLCLHLLTASQSSSPTKKRNTSKPKTPAKASTQASKKNPWQYLDEDDEENQEEIDDFDIELADYDENDDDFDDDDYDFDENDYDNDEDDDFDDNHFDDDNDDEKYTRRLPRE